MRLITGILISANELSQEDAARLLRIAPGELKHGSLSISLPESDPRLQLLRAELELLRRRPWTDLSRARVHGIEYWTGTRREYDTGELNEFALLSLQVPHGSRLGDSNRFRSHVLQIYKSELTLRHIRSFDIGQTTAGWLLVSDHFKRVMRDAALVAVRTLPVEYHEEPSSDDGSLDWSSFGEPCWELSSEITLPPVSPAMVKVDHKGNPVERTYDRFVLVSEPEGGGPTEYRYLKNEVDNLPKFDVALSYENNQRGGSGGWLIVSQRFRQVCLSNDVDVNFVPVHLDP